MPDDDVVGSGAAVSRLFYQLVGGWPQAGKDQGLSGGPAGGRDDEKQGTLAQGRCG